MNINSRQLRILASLVFICLLYHYEQMFLWDNNSNGSTHKKWYNKNKQIRNALKSSHYLKI